MRGDVSKGIFVTTSELADAVLKLSNDSNLHKRLSLNGRSYVQENFSVEKLIEDIENQYKTLIT